MAPSSPSRRIAEDSERLPAAALMEFCSSCFNGIVGLFGSRGPKRKTKIIDSLLSSPRLTVSLNHNPLSSHMSAQVIRVKRCNMPFRNFYRTDICEKLGSGGFGDVYKTVQKATGKSVAVKSIRKEKMEEEGEMDLLHEEISALVALDHPNILKMIEYFEDDTTVFIVTDLAQGGDLHAFMKMLDSRHLSERDVHVARAFRQLMEGVAYCHRRKIMHRDLKMENCLFVDQGFQILKVIDFGLAAVCQGQLGVMLGTPDYMSPEMISMRPHDEKTDIWSAGVIFYVLLTGVHPFKYVYCRSNEELYGRVINGPYYTEPLEERHASDEICELVDLLLQKQADKRPTAQEVATSAWLESMEVCPSPTSQRRHWRHTIRSFTSYSKVSRFEQALMSFIASQVTENEVLELQETFKRLDANGDGFLSQAEVTDAFRMCDMSVQEADLQAVFDSFADTSDGVLRYTDWLAATLRPQILASEEAAKAAFDFFDADGNGKVEKSELVEVLGEDEAVRILHQCGASEKDMLEEEDFIKIVAHLAKCRKKAIHPRDSPLVPEGRDRVSSFMEAALSPMVATMKPRGFRGS
eukprot:TRINITY_DN7225_c0_g1_i2.p1 TRINITY_DN7225_c0_g1~~TRINITY_DN7225_c0_g1_i2.p1  ORF type:complete len:580 (+),score=138.36 TRINITY_DN7225_c0_g1_i2:69-1808(+)